MPTANFFVYTTNLFFNALLSFKIVALTKVRDIAYTISLINATERRYDYIYATQEQDNSKNEIEMLIHIYVCRCTYFDRMRPLLTSVSMLTYCIYKEMKPYLTKYYSIHMCY